MEPSPGGIRRRTVLKAAVGGLAGAPVGVLSQLRESTAAGAGALQRGADAGSRGAERPHAAVAPAADRILAYVAGLRRPDGGFGWPDQPDSYLAAAFACAGVYRALGRPVPDARAAAAMVRAGHPIRGPGAETRLHAADLRTFVYQQAQALLWLGESADEFAAEVRRWREPSAYPTTYERRGYPVFEQEMMAFVCRTVLGLPMTDLAPTLVQYLDSRRRPDGSFNNTPAADGSGGNVLNAYWGLLALAALGRAGERAAETAAWLRGCQLPCGGFTHQPQAALGGLDCAAYTWAAVKALALLKARPADADGCVAYVRSLQNADGGFGHRPGWPSDPVATCYAVESLAALGAMDALDVRVPRPDRPAVENVGGALPRPDRPAVAPAAAIPAAVRPFTIQIEAPGKGSPADAVELARALRIDLWGGKNADPAWLARAQALADRRGAAVRFFSSNEEYGTYVSLPGHGTYSHLSDVMAPAGSDFGPSMAGAGDVPWPEFRDRRIGALGRAGGRMLWQICDNEPAARVILDDGLLKRPGYSAISTFHFGCTNMAYTLPFVFSYQHVIPLAALQDAHCEEPWWWADDLAGYRTLFLAERPTWEGWLAALERNWVVAVRHDAVTRFRTRILGGAPGVQDCVRRFMDQWKWWDEGNTDLRRPMASLAAVGPEEPFERDRPARGIRLRLRVAQANTKQGRPGQPYAEPAGMKVDGRPVEAREVVRREQAKGKPALLDRCFVFDVENPGPGPHRAEAAVRRLSTGELATVRTEF
ncbi:MAG: terpene cyclase/mutase family protein [Planctomycetes bacterium]|nr:terpene cyclase/mutase family protein [Planctomycetota bacterium]